jgi:3-methyladenine DNA glycosylase AlkD
MSIVTHLTDQLTTILTAYAPANPRPTADSLRDLWRQGETKSIAGIKAELRAQQETMGVAVPMLKEIGAEIGKAARKRVDDFIPLARLLWDEYGREGRVVTVHILGPLELTAPEKIIPIVLDLCRTCLTWEDADQLAMNALEPIVRRKPAQWLSALEPWLDDGNKWVRRAGVTVIARLPMKHAAYTVPCLTLTERLLLDEEQDVKRAVSFAIRMAARGDIAPVREFLARQVPPENPAATWVLCDAVRSMAKQFLPQFASLLPRYQQWLADPALSGQDHRSVESAVKILQEVSK